MLRFFSRMILVLVLCAMASGFWLWREYQQFLGTPVLAAEAETQTLLIQKGTSFQGMVRQLEQQGLTEFSWRWQVLGRLQQPLVKAGEYRLEPGLGVQGLLEKLASNDVVAYYFTIIEGWTSAQLLAALAEMPHMQADQADLTAAQLLAELETVLDAELLQQINNHAAANLAVDSGDPEHYLTNSILEGLFLPETYSYQRGETGLALLQRAAAAMQAELNEHWQQYQTNVNEAQRQLDSAYELLILASIIEKESGVAAEREQIAGVFTRRLRRGIALQTDPTVIYGIENYDGNIRKVDLQTDTLYNTYTRPGLPPTPIALAGSAAIAAAASPAPGDSLYFVARGDGSGGHVFSNSLSEHNRAVQAYLRARRSHSVATDNPASVPATVAPVTAEPGSDLEQGSDSDLNPDDIEVDSAAPAMPNQRDYVPSASAAETDSGEHDTGDNEQL